MYIRVIARHAEVNEEGDDRAWLVSVEAFLSDHHPHLGYLLRIFSQYRGIELGRENVQSVLLDVQSVLKSYFCCF